MTPMKIFRHLLIITLLLASTAIHAADPAKTMFGIELGSRFAIPVCARGEDTMAKRYCYAEALSTKTAWGSEERHVFYPRAETVPWARGEMVVDVINGVIEAIHVNTWGIEAQTLALDEMTRKYGPPSRSRSEKIKGLRSRWPTKYAEWDLRDFSVRLDGTTGSVDWGRVTLATPRYHKILKDHAARR
ncbi:MAG: hypothetical protein K2X06_13205 [Burkholderiales bacterium]|nr:hypothetical protein [Burkholderiales bacterium]